MTQLLNAWLVEADAGDARPPPETPASTALAVPVGPARDEMPRAMPVTPIGVIDGDRYVFLRADQSAAALTFPELLDETLLRKLFGGDAWLKFYFPRQVLRRDGVAGRWVFVAVGIETIIAAEFLAGLCIEKEIARARQALPPPEPGPRWYPFRPRTWVRAVTRFVAGTAGGRS